MFLYFLPDLHSKSPLGVLVVSLQGILKWSPGLDWLRLELGVVHFDLGLIVRFRVVALLATWTKFVVPQVERGGREQKMAI